MKGKKRKEKKGPKEKEKFAHIQIAGTSTSSKDQLHNAEYFWIDTATHHGWVFQSKDQLFSLPTYTTKEVVQICSIPQFSTTTPSPIFR